LSESEIIRKNAFRRA